MSEDDSGASDEMPEVTLSSFVPIRHDLARGDRRALYLGWLLSAQIGERVEEDREPPVPPGLSRLSGALASLADFLGLDEVLLEVAARASPHPAFRVPSRQDVAAWVARLSAGEKNRFITDSLMGGASSAVGRLLTRFQKHTERSQTPPPQAARASRTVGDLLAAAEALREERTTPP